MIKFYKFTIKNFVSSKYKNSNITQLINQYEPIYFKDHYPVMWRNILGIIDQNITSELSEENRPKAIGDFTIGCGNHTSLILKRFKNAYVIGVDLDTKMINYTHKKLKKFIAQKRLVLVEDNYVEVDALNVCELYGNNSIFSNRKKFDFMLVDLGYNSLQLEDKEKGISFKDPDAPLDMRYDLDNENKSKAYDILNHATEFELMEIFSKYGEERYYEALTKNILKQRDVKRYETVGDFLNTINDTYSNKATEKFSTYTRLFQALRISVNYELLNLQRFLSKSLFNLEENGILCMISFHSLEDKIVANIIKEWQKNNLGQSLFTHGIKPSATELEENSRSHSAILRAFKFKPYNSEN